MYEKYFVNKTVPEKKIDEYVLVSLSHLQIYELSP